MMDKGCCGTGVWAGKWDPFTRLCYQFGMLLGVDEFAQEQGYLVTKHRLLQRVSVGFGLVWGTPVVVDDTKGTLTVGPLYALDELGRELWVKDPCTIDLNGWLRENPTVDDKTPIYVTIAYAPCCVAPIPAVAAPCDDSASPTMPSRVRESVSVSLGRDLPPAPIDLSDTPPSKGGPDQAARWKTFVQLISDDADRPLLLATVTSKPANPADPTSVQTVSVVTPNDALPRITVALGAPVSGFSMTKAPAPLVGQADAAPFHVVAIGVDTLAKELVVRFNLTPVAATKDSFKVQMYEVPKPGGFTTPKSLVKDAPKFDASDNHVLRVPLTALPDKGNAVRVTVAGAGDAAVLGWDGHALLAVNDGADFVFTFTP